MKIIAAGLNDLEALSELFNLYRQFYKQRDDIHACRTFIADRLNQQDSKIFIAYNRENDQDHAAGFIQIYFSYSSVSMQKSHILNDLFIVESQRNKGIARALMHAASDFAKQDHAKGLSLSTSIDNHAAQMLYQSLGYVKDDAFYRYFLSVSDG